MKGVSEVVVIVLILLIGVSVTAVLYIWASETAFSIYPEETQDVAYMRQRACLGIMTLTETEVVINNCGSVPLKNLKLYINGELQNIVLPSQLDPWEEKTIFINLVNDDRVQITSDYAYSPVVEFIPESNINPIAEFSFTFTGTAFQFIDESTDEDGSIVSWSWSFGTGGTSSAQNPTYTYQDYANVYNVTLTVTDNRGGTSSKTIILTISSNNDCLITDHCLEKYPTYPRCVSCGPWCVVGTPTGGDWKYYTCDTINPATGVKNCIVHTNWNTCCSC